MGSRQTPLRVKNLKGETITATVELKNGRAFVTVPYIEAVEKDNPAFAENGIIDFSVPQIGYQKAKRTITSYLENIFLKERNKNETVHSSNGGKSNSRRVKTEPTPGSDEKAPGENDNSVRNRGRGEKQSESDRGGSENLDLAASGDSENVGGGEGGN